MKIVLSRHLTHGFTIKELFFAPVAGLSAAFDDRRYPSYITHPLRDLIGQRVYQIACGYEDGNDADQLRKDA